MNGVGVEVLTAADDPPVEVILDCYREVYAEAPYCEGPGEVEAFAKTWPGRRSAPGFRLAVARDRGRVVGFTFGHLLAARTRWWEGALEPLDLDTTEWEGRTFAVIELAVRRPYRRQGLAGRLLDALLLGVDAERVTLLVRVAEDAAPARALYAKLGYRKVGRVQPFPPDGPVFFAMVKDLP
jgi:ribosomal protein S18 acetylase RimI-like enzyme